MARGSDPVGTLATVGILAVFGYLAYQLYRRGNFNTTDEFLKKITDVVSTGPVVGPETKQKLADLWGTVFPGTIKVPKTP